MADPSQSNVPRLAVYGIATTVLTAGVIASAFLQHQYFYTACVQLAQSSASMMVLANMGILLTILLGKLMVRVFFGQLRAIEVEHLYEQGWFAVTETCLALTIFRDEFDAATLTLFVFLLFCKVFHWILEDRVTFMEQQPRLSKLFIVRMSSLAALLASVDVFMLAYAVRVTRMYGATMMIVFGFEYALLLVHFHSTSVKFVLNAIDMRRDGEWEEKTSYVFYLEMLTDLAKLIVYFGFMMVLLMYYGLPLHILRDMYMTTRSFINKCRDWVRYRRAMQNMHLRYPTVSEEELEQMSDRTCIICREDMHGPARQVVEQWNQEREEGRAPAIGGDTPKKLPCGHVFHFNCLRSWLERQQSCPTCRHPVLDDDTQHTRAAAGAPAAPTAPAAGGSGGVERGGDGEQNNGTDSANTGQESQQGGHQSNANSSGSSSSAAPAAAAAAAPGEPSSGSGSGQTQPSRTSLLQSRTNTAAAPGSTGTNSVLPFLPGFLSPSDPRARRTHAANTQASLGGGSSSLSAANLIPVFPQSLQGTSGPYIPSLAEFPMPDLTALSDTQIRNLESDTRAAVSERIRILSALQVQLSHMVVALTQVQSIPAPAATEQGTVAKEPLDKVKEVAEPEISAPVHDSVSDYDVVDEDEDEDEGTEVAPLIGASSKGKEPDIY